MEIELIGGIKDGEVMAVLKTCHHVKFFKCHGLSGPLGDNGDKVIKLSDMEEIYYDWDGITYNPAGQAKFYLRK